MARSMKKILKLVFAFSFIVALLGLSACNANDSGSNNATNNPPPVTGGQTEQPPAGGSTDTTTETTTTEEPSDPNVLRIALVVDYGGIDDGSFNQGAWEGVVQFAQPRGLTHDNFTPAVFATNEYVESISLAARRGAEVVVTPGFMFADAIDIAQDEYPEVNFILLDAVPSVIGPNTVSVLYAEQEAGFLAGYAAVHDGFRSFGFMGGIPVPPVVLFGMGFAEGAEYAASVLGLAPGEVTLNYHYVMTFNADPAVQTMAASWYASGVEVIFAAAGGAGSSVMAAAEAADGWVIGVDSDQANDSHTVLTSAMKMLTVSVVDILEMHFNGEFPGGTIKLFDAAADGVGLPMNTSRFREFSQSQYDEIFGRLQRGEINVSSNFEDVNQNGMGVLGLTLVSVNEL